MVMVPECGKNKKLFCTSSKSPFLLYIYLFVDRALRNKLLIMTKHSVQKMLDVFLNSEVLLLRVALPLQWLRKLAN